ncbi:hypothetical protein OAJ14_08050 [Polaribacter sp.]|nr:hypothetical protein [Polaribacter sp.]
MFLRVFTFCLLIFFITSCDKFSFSKNTINQELDTLVNFSSVDMYPSFKSCDTLIEKTKKAACFRANIHQRIEGELHQHSFIIKEAIDEIIFVDLIINSRGIIILDSIQSPIMIKTTLTKLDSLIKSSIQKLPKIFPAIKRGIPVTTKYRLPIQIQLKE